MYSIYKSVRYNTSQRPQQRRLSIKVGSGLSFIPFGVSCSIASVGSGYLIDRNYRRVAKQAGIKIDIKRGDNMRDFSIELARIEFITAAIYPGIAARPRLWTGPGPRSPLCRPHCFALLHEPLPGRVLRRYERSAYGSLPK